MLRIRFQKVGKKKQPTYRVVVVHSKQSIRGKYLENLGIFNPRDKKFNLNAERINYWLKSGAKPSVTAHNLLVKSGIITGPKMPVKIKKSVKINKPELASTPAAIEVPAEQPVVSEEKSDTQAE